MASQDGVTAANSRLAQMQMRFQQKQQQEREQKRVEMNDESRSATPADLVDTNRLTNGKVRQMFNERRRGVGIDRANPLKPITTTNTSISRQAGGTAVLPTKNGNTIAARGSRATPPNSIQNVSLNARSNPLPSKRLQNGNYHADNLTKEMSSLSLGLQYSGSDERNNNMRHGDVMGRAKSSNNLKLNPVITKKTPPSTGTLSSSSASAAIQNNAKRSPNSSSMTATRQSPTTNSMPRVGPTVKATTLKVPPAQVMKTPPRRSTGGMASNAAHKTNSPSTNDHPDAANMSSCRFCHRHFNPERLAKHEQICEKMAHTKRKTFDAARHRLRGTDAEKYLKKASSTRKTVTSSSKTSAYSSAAAASGMNAGMKKNNWRKKHEEFIQAIRAAKQVQAHLARGGKLSDLPPPPPSENPDYIQCPHCSRRFNESAAERHIPRCATMLHNKPKPAGAKRR